MNLKNISRLVRKNRLLNKIILFDSIDSTNKYLMENDFASGTVVAARTQSLGRGKQGAKWVSGKGGLWFSFVINKKIVNPYMFVVAASVAVTETMAGCGIKPAIKWPNDILVGSSKICGILIENDSFNGRIVTGIGINLNNSIPRGLNAISLKTAAKKHVDEEEFFVKLLKKLDLYVSGINTLKKKLVALWVKNQADITGREISVIRHNKKEFGRVKKVNKDGSVRVKMDSGKTLRIKGEVFFL